MPAPSKKRAISEGDSTGAAAGWRGTGAAICVGTYVVRVRTTCFHGRTAGSSRQAANRICQ